MRRAVLDKSDDFVERVLAEWKATRPRDWVKQVTLDTNQFVVLSKHSVNAASKTSQAICTSRFSATRSSQFADWASPFAPFCPCTYTLHTFTHTLSIDAKSNPGVDSSPPPAARPPERPLHAPSRALSHLLRAPAHKETPPTITRLHSDPETPRRDVRRRRAPPCRPPLSRPV